MVKNKDNDFKNTSQAKRYFYSTINLLSIPEAVFLGAVQYSSGTISPHPIDTVSLPLIITAQNLTLDIATGTDVENGTALKVLDATRVLDDDLMLANSSQHVVTQQSMVAYTTSLVAGNRAFRGIMPVPADLQTNTTGNAYADGSSSYKRGDHFVAEASGDLTVSDGVVAVNITDSIFILNDVADAAITVADVAKNASSSEVITVFGRKGIVVATNGDYTASQVTNVPSGNITQIQVQLALNELDGFIDTKMPVLPTNSGGRVVESVNDNTVIESSVLITSLTTQGNVFNGANQLVKLDASALYPNNSGVNITALNGTNITTGTVANARLATQVTLQANTFNGSGELLKYGSTYGGSMNSNIKVAYSGSLGVRWLDSGGTIRSHIHSFTSLGRLLATNFAGQNTTGPYITFGGLDWISSSDLKLKVNIKTLNEEEFGKDNKTSCLDFIKGISVISYDQKLTKPAIDFQTDCFVELIT